MPAMITRSSKPGVGCWVRLSTNCNHAARRREREAQNALTIRQPWAWAIIYGGEDILDCTERYRSPWFFGEYGFVLGRPRAFAKPIPFRGRLGMFDVTIPVARLEGARVGPAIAEVTA